MARTYQHVLITGASSGIGRAVALSYAEPGVRLSLGGRDKARLDEVADACRSKGADVAAEVVDVRDAAMMERWLTSTDEAHPLDLVIAGAGITTGLGDGRLIESAESVRAIFAINVDGVLNTVLPILPRFVARDRGRVAMVGSLAAYRALPYSPAYCATKAAVHLWAQSLRAGLAQTGVGVTLIAPGFVKTPLNAEIESPRPLQLNDAQAAKIIKSGLDAKRDLIAFPWLVYAGTRLLDLLPPRIVDWVMRRIRVEIPETREGARPGSGS
ncbi:MAG: SDR family NAD(P)-dependent oxidoreductase [Alphaproteobacteria bacterium]